MIVDDPLARPPAPPTPSIVAGTLPVQVRINPGVHRVKPGTPLAPYPRGGWGPDPTAPQLIAGESVYGGELCGCYRSCILDFHRPIFTPETSYTIHSVNDLGDFQLIPLPAGPILALTQSKLLFDAGDFRFHLLQGRKLSPDPTNPINPTTTDPTTTDSPPGLSGD